jgi:hypothetical protein
MAFPDEIVTFPTILNITASDAPIVQQFQAAMQAGDFTTAQTLLATIPNGSQKLIGADYINSLATTIVNVENYFAQRYSPAYVVSSTQPTAQAATDFWFEVVT